MLAESYLVSVPLESATFLARTAAKLIDFVLIGTVATGIIWSTWWLLRTTGFVETYPTIAALLIPVCVLTFVLILPAYFVIAEYVTDQTLGKRLLGIRVVRESGARISLGQSFVRQIRSPHRFSYSTRCSRCSQRNSQRAFELISKTRVVEVDDEQTA